MDFELTLACLFICVGKRGGMKSPPKGQMLTPRARYLLKQPLWRGCGWESTGISFGPLIATAGEDWASLHPMPLQTSRFLDRAFADSGPRVRHGPPLGPPPSPTPSTPSQLPSPTSHPRPRWFVSTCPPSSAWAICCRMASSSAPCSSAPPCGCGVPSPRIAPGMMVEASTKHGAFCDNFWGLKAGSWWDDALKSDEIGWTWRVWRDETLPKIGWNRIWRAGCDFYQCFLAGKYFVQAL